MFNTSTSITVPSSYYDPVTHAIVYPPSFTRTSADNYMLVGGLALFADVPAADVPGSVPASRVLNSDGSYSKVCLSGGCYPGDTLWDSVMGVANSDANVGFFMVKAVGAVPEPGMALTWVLGLLGLGAVKLRRRA